MASSRTGRKSFFAAVAIAALGIAAAAFAQSEIAAKVGKTYAESAEGPKFQFVKAKAGAPNIVLIILDDVGFGASSAFGGPVSTPNFEKLADRGLRYTNFHTTGVCAPTRAALMTGRNHHKVSMGMFPHDFMSAEFPGYTGRIGPQNGTIAEYLRAAGYSTYALGKWHLTPDAELTDLGPFDRWPSGKGFDHFFGFLGGAEDQYKTKLVEDNNNVKPDGRHLNAQLIDKAIFYVDRQEKLAPEKPFFLYLATGAAHSPHQVEKVWLDKYKGKFDAGWDVFRQQIFEKQKKLGVIPKDAILPARDDRVPAWNTLSADQKKVYARFMEGYAAYLDYTDFELGRFFDHLKAEKLFDNTAVFVIIGDNGSSKEGGNNGTLFPEFGGPSKDDKGQIADLVDRFDDIGTKKSYSNYPIGWAQTLNTPFRKWKADANTEGGTRNPLIVSWPKALPKAGIRTQYGHVIDILPTVLEISGASVPAEVKGVKQEPIQGTSLAYSFQQAKAATRHNEQYYFLFGAGSIVKDGWKASFGYRPDFDDLFSHQGGTVNPQNNAGKDVWELYNLNADFNERIDIAAKNPAKLKELQTEFAKQAEENQVYPLINWSDVTGKLKAVQKKGSNPVLAPASDYDKK